MGGPARGPPRARWSASPAAASACPAESTPRAQTVNACRAMKSGLSRARDLIPSLAAPWRLRKPRPSASANYSPAEVRVRLDKGRWRIRRPDLGPFPHPQLCMRNDRTP